MIELSNIFESHDPEVAVSRLDNEQLLHLINTSKVHIDIEFREGFWRFIFALNINPEEVEQNEETEGWRDVYTLSMPISQWTYLVTLGLVPRSEAFRSFLLMTAKEDEELTWHYQDDYLRVNETE